MASRGRLSIDFLLNDEEDDYSTSTSTSLSTSSSSSSSSALHSSDDEFYVAGPSHHAVHVMVPNLPSFAAITALASYASSAFSAPKPTTTTLRAFSHSPSSPFTSVSSSSSASSSPAPSSPASPVACFMPTPMMMAPIAAQPAMVMPSWNASAPTTSVADMLEGLLRTVGPRAFASDDSASSGSGSDDDSVSMTTTTTSTATTKESRGRRKGRRQASSGQVGLLEEVFALEPIPSALTKARLSQLLDMPPKRIQIWFKNKRARQKKGRPRKEPFTFHYFASANPAHRVSRNASLHVHPMRPATGSRIAC